MITISEVKGAIFDVDDTLLDNQPGQPGMGLHERSRLAAFQFVGKKYDIVELANITVEENLIAFNTAPVHSLYSAVWNHLWRSGLVDSEVMSPGHALLEEIVAKKNELHVDVLQNEAREVPGSTKFIHQLAASGLEGEMAVASSAIRRDIDTYFKKMDLEKFFPSEKIKSFESATHVKPNPELFNLAFDSLHLDESDRRFVLAFEDDPRGIMAAKTAGLYVCAITTRFSKQELNNLEVPPDVAADSYLEFSQLLGMKTD